MPEKKTFGEWLRKNAEKYLMEAAADEMRKLYPGMCAGERYLFPFTLRFHGVYARR